MNFNQQVWEMCRQIPRGNVSTYGEIARALGTKAYQAVGNALNKNPYAPLVPCHRVVSSDGSLGGFAHGTSQKIALLCSEGVVVVDGKIVDFEKKLYTFKFP